jgi:hypothetical protein
VAHTYNPSYSGGRDQEDCSLKAAWAGSSPDPILKNLLQKRAIGVAQGVGPEFKPQDHKTTTATKKRQLKLMTIKNKEQNLETPNVFGLWCCYYLDECHLRWALFFPFADEDPEAQRCSVLCQRSWE